MHTDAELIRLHASLRKEAGLAPTGLMEQLKLHGPVLTGAAVGGLTAPQGKELESVLAGAAGGVVGGAMGNPYQGAVLGPVAYNIYNHLTTPDPEDVHGSPYPL